MGEIAEMMAEGILCTACGGYVDDRRRGPPRQCGWCRRGQPTTRRPTEPPLPRFPPLAEVERRVAMAAAEERYQQWRQRQPPREE